MPDGQQKHFQKRELQGSADLTRLYQENTERYPYVLISTTDYINPLNRYDILFAFPQQSISLNNDLSLSAHNYDTGDNASGFLDNFQTWWQSLKLNSVIENDVPFHGGWFMYLSYELVAEIEPSLSLPLPEQPVPVAMAVRCPAAIIHDREKSRFYAIAENEYVHLLDEMQRDFENIKQISVENQPKNVVIEQITEGNTEDYLDQVGRVKQYIRDGDVFQANLSRLWQIEINEAVDDACLFQNLSQSNPGSFAALVHIPGATVISSSPERLVSVAGHVIQTRPIAGTRRRSATASTDDALARELLQHPKERAEHIMLIDLERNDLGRICTSGSIEVNELMTLESYRHVHHIVSNVRGKLREHITPSDVIRAVFPGGTITGCPKVRCMQILAEMEQQARGAYTGSVGYINRDGSMDLNILIRTMQRSGKTVTIRAGGGIVTDSDPVAELEETRAKARGLLAAFDQNQSPCTA